MLLALTLGCDDDECESLSIDECRESSECSVTELFAWDEARSCWGDSEPAACLPKGTGCGGGVGCVLDPDGRRWQTGGCAPRSWQSFEDGCLETPFCRALTDGGTGP
jgi:hypothetical protein